MNRYNRDNFYELCDAVALLDEHLRSIIKTYGYPPFWSRPNTFETLVHIILEQQVSLASALATLNKLKERIGEVTPSRVLLLTDEELKQCYFSRQKTGYVKYLAEALISGQLDLDLLPGLTEAEIRTKLTALKGIGNWTVDVYLMFVVHYPNIFPAGDLAAIQALKELKQLPKATGKDFLITLSAKWQPYRTIATMLLWHYYLSKRNRLWP
ncbi:DNA-3-methyladenine glycosylase 2 family protein [Mucilaginibacter sp. RS28]|uniref:DNA-3-methyladenine glycosylase II n=1 Tax=Mucilaginibacter straminoryzae TaxID=2932774 RepID=A0A9X1X5L9_9SPHI|nr:DNA-3-methyladenine glycosylase 2 family protein [Mucilaginibacter straminoryzae]MCJ8210875.1 DNA-3-methyladenine glycosylase 2 family protein [Mucilaginibacter straminoryzae]